MMANVSLASRITGDHVMRVGLIFGGTVTGVLSMLGGSLTSAA